MDVIWRDTDKTVWRDPETGAQTVAWADPERDDSPDADAARWGVPAVDHGLDANADAATNTAALVAALAAGKARRLPVILPGGTFAVNELTVHGPCLVVGAGPKLTTLIYQGTGTAITTATPGIRTYGTHISGVNIEAATEGAVGIDMDSMSSSVLSDVQVKKFTVGVSLWSEDAGGGGCVYNRLQRVDAVLCGTGFQLRHGANATVMHGCRGNACGTCWDVADCNDNTITAAQAESSTTAFKFAAGALGAADWNRVVDCRVEFCTTGFDVGANVRDLVVRGLWIDSSTETHFADLGPRTRRASDLIYVTATNSVVRLDSGWQFISGSHVGVGSASGTFNSYFGYPVYLKGQAADNSAAIGCWIGNTPTLTDPAARIVGFCADTPGAHTQPRSYVRADGAYEFAGGPLVLSGAGSPESAVVAPVGSMYLRSDGGAGTALYVKESGVGDTGWVAK